MCWLSKYWLQKHLSRLACVTPGGWAGGPEAALWFGRPEWIEHRHALIQWKQHVREEFSPELTSPDIFLPISKSNVFGLLDCYDFFFQNFYLSTADAWNRERVSLKTLCDVSWGLSVCGKRTDITQDLPYFSSSIWWLLSCGYKFCHMSANRSFMWSYL